MKGRSRQDHIVMSRLQVQSAVPCLLVCSSTLVHGIQRIIFFSQGCLSMFTIQGHAFNLANCGRCPAFWWACFFSEFFQLPTMRRLWRCVCCLLRMDGGTLCSVVIGISLMQDKRLKHSQEERHNFVCQCPVLVSLRFSKGCMYLGFPLLCFGFAFL